MAKGDHPHRKDAKGATGGGYARPRVQIGFDPKTIEAITKRAKQNDRSFAAEIRAIVEEALASPPANLKEIDDYDAMLATGIVPDSLKHRFNPPPHS
jgi:hypothetical protein